jgi:hypothetical protein
VCWFEAEVGWIISLLLETTFGDEPDRIINSPLGFGSFDLQ